MAFYIVNEDITEMEVDGVVNAANAQLCGGGGVDGAIHAAAGPDLDKACAQIGGCPTGECVVTWGYDMDAIYIIHAVGPIYRDGKSGEEKLLRSCYEKAVELAVTHGCRTVAFPVISAGAYGYPKEEALAIAVEEIGKGAQMHEKLDFYLTITDQKILGIAKEKYAQYFE